MQASVPAYAHTLFATCCWMECEHLMGHGVKKLRASSSVMRQPCAGSRVCVVVRAVRAVRASTGQHREHARPSTTLEFSGELFVLLPPALSYTQYWKRPDVETDDLRSV